MKKATIFLFTLGLFFQAKSQKIENISFTHEGIEVYGTFIKPNAGDIFPTIIINPGSGSNDRNGTLYLDGDRAHCLYPNLVGKTLLSYRNLANAMVNAGYAVLIYDELSYTYSDPNAIGTPTFEKLWLQANSAVDYVKTREDVNKNRVILFGHSEGASIISYIANKRNDIAGLVAIGGSRTPLDSLLMRQVIDFARICEEDTVQAHQSVAQLSIYFNIIRNKTWNQQTPYLFGLSPELWHTYLSKMDSVAHYYNQIYTSTLFVGLGLDYNVPPSELERFRNEVKTNADFWLIDSLNHYMTDMHTPQISKTLTDTIIYWLNSKYLTSVSSLPKNQSHLEIYPNPAHDFITIKPNSDEVHLHSINIFDAMGRKVNLTDKITVDSNQIVIDLSSLPNGIYYLQVGQNQNSSSYKFIKN